jgi:SAM-dependent methyltransferase
MTLLEHDTEAFDESHYDRKYFEGHIARYEARVYRQRVANVERFMGDVAGKHVLDLGCGVGFFGGTARKRGARVVGLDFSAVALELCKGREPGMGVVRGDATRLPFPDARFDVVLLNDIIEHLAEEPGRRMIEEVYRVLRPGGHLVVDTDNDEFIMGRKAPPERLAGEGHAAARGPARDQEDLRRADAAHQDLRRARAARAARGRGLPHRRLRHLPLRRRALARRLLQPAAAARAVPPREGRRADLPGAQAGLKARAATLPRSGAPAREHASAPARR